MRVSRVAAFTMTNLTFDTNSAYKAVCLRRSGEGRGGGGKGGKLHVETSNRTIRTRGSNQDERYP